jgi:hypothetical protein
MNTSDKLEALREINRKANEAEREKAQKAADKKKAEAEANERAKYKAFKKEMDKLFDEVVVSVGGIEFTGREIVGELLKVPKGFDQYASDGLMYSPDKEFRKFLISGVKMPGAHDDLEKFIVRLEQAGFIVHTDCGTVRKYGVGSDSYDWDETTYHYELSSMAKRLMGIK